MKRVLVVEDEEGHAELLERALEHAADVVLASNLASARGALERTTDPIDIVLADVRLPDGLGVDLLDEVAAAVPVVIMTSHGDERGAVDAIKRGAYDYVVKSAIAFEEMPRVVERVLRESRHAQKEAELRAALLRSERLAAIGTAAATLAHEIGNPLNSISLSSQLMERRLAKLDVEVGDLRELNAMVRREIDRLASLLAEFRGLAREPNLALEPLEVRGLFARAVGAQQAALDEGRVTIALEVPDDLVVVANREKMSQVLVNLFKNAIEAMPEGGLIVLGARDAGDDAIILTVTDDGPGIPAEIDVFAPFATTKDAGTGLGLAVVAQILASHGGRAWHEPPADGGARFCLQLLKASPQG